MHLEFQELLREALIASDGPSGLPASCAAAWRNMDFRALRFDVDNCPKDIPCAIAANLSFVISSWLTREAKAAAAEYSPIELARYVFGLQNKGDGQRFFRIQISESGHLNAIPTELFVQQFVNSVFESGAKFLFINDSFLIAKSACVANQETFVITSEWWNKVCLSQDPAVKELLQQRFAGRLASSDDWLELLGVVSDPEMDVRPYLGQLMGRENIPWYLSKFRQDWRSFTEKCFSAVGNNPCQGLSWLPPIASGKRSSQQLVEILLHEAVCKILGFRQVYFSACQRKRPELLFRELLNVVRIFYSFYNHPEVRSLFRIGPATLANLFRVTSIVGYVVERSLDLFEFPCENPDFVLKV